MSETDFTTSETASYNTYQSKDNDGSDLNYSLENYSISQTNQALESDGDFKHNSLRSRAYYSQGSSTFPVIHSKLTKGLSKLKGKKHKKYESEDNTQGQPNQKFKSLSTYLHRLNRSNKFLQYNSESDGDYSNNTFSTSIKKSNSSLLLKMKKRKISKKFASQIDLANPSMNDDDTNQYLTDERQTDYKNKTSLNEMFAKVKRRLPLDSAQDKDKYIGEEMAPYFEMISDEEFTRDFNASPESRKKARTCITSVTDAFSKMIGSHNLSLSNQEQLSFQGMSCIVELEVISAVLKEKLNTYVIIQHEDIYKGRTKCKVNSAFPAWNEKLEFDIFQLETPLELQIIRRHRLWSDRIIGRSFINLYTVNLNTTIEVPISGYYYGTNTIQKVGNLHMKLNLRTQIPDTVSHNIHDDIREKMIEKPPKPNYKNLLRLNILRYFGDKKMNRRKRNPYDVASSASIYDRIAEESGVYIFNPLITTQIHLDRRETSTSVAWKPFSFWPGNCVTPTRYITIVNEISHITEIRRPIITWPIEFLLPMSRLTLPSTASRSPYEVAWRAVVLIHLVGARGLRSLPMVKAQPQLKDSAYGDVSGTLAMPTPETCAASIVAYQWAANTLTAPPKPAVIFQHGSEKRTSKVSKNSFNPNWFEDFEFLLYNGSPRWIKILVVDEETQGGAGGVIRSNILAESVIDLMELPLELTQYVELQLMKNSSIARLLFTITITGISTGRAEISRTGSLELMDNNISEDSLRNQNSHSTLSLFKDDLNQETKYNVKNQMLFSKEPLNLREMVENHYSLKNSFKSFDDVGWLKVKIIGAMGLGGRAQSEKVEVVCGLEFINCMLKTQPIVKSSNPQWDRTFIIPVTDIHANLIITVSDIEKNKVEIIGRVAIHLLRIKNGKGKWYALKCSELKEPAKGSILLEITLIFNHTKAALRTFKPRETIYSSLAKRQKDVQLSQIRQLHQRWEHIKPLFEFIRWIRHSLEYLMSWKNPFHSTLGLVIYIILVCNFKIYYVPLLMVLLLLKNRFFMQAEEKYTVNLRHNKYAVQYASSNDHETYEKQLHKLENIYRSSVNKSDMEDQGNPDTYWMQEDGSRTNKSKTIPDPYLLPLQENGEYFEDDIEDNGSSLEVEDLTSQKEIKKTLRSKLASYREATTKILEVVEGIASFWEQLCGTFNWRISWLSWMAVVVLMILVVFLYYLPIKVLFLIWGVNKFTKQLLRPNSIKHNIIKDFLSCVPNLIETYELAELRPDAFRIRQVGSRIKSSKK